MNSNEKIVIGPRVRMLWSIMNSLKNNKGISLIEVIISITIMAIVTGPFLGTIVMSTRNNVYSERVLRGTELAQRVMEEIKSRPEFLEEQSETQITDYSDYLEENGYVVRYRIVRRENEISALSDTYELDEAAMGGDLELYVDFGRVEFNGIVYNDFEFVQYGLKFSETNGVKKYEFYKYEDENNDNIEDVQELTVMQAASLLNATRLQPIKVNISYLNECSQPFRLNVNVDGLNEDDTVFFNIIDDKNDSLELCNTGTKTFYQLDEVSNTEKYYNVLYEIELVVDYGGEELNTMISYVKKNR